MPGSFLQLATRGCTDLNVQWTSGISPEPHIDVELHFCSADKNNGNLNLRLMGQFRRALNTCQLKEQEVHMEQ
jgi:hypothetical protein